MDEAFKAVLKEYEARAERESAMPLTMETRDERLLWVGRAGAELLHLLIVGAEAKNILEVGTSYGYSTLWFADAARRTGGRVTTLELSAAKSDYAKAMLTKAGLDGYVDFRVGDALKILPTLPGPIEFVFLDLWKELYVPTLEIIAPKLAPGALVTADNMTNPPPAIPDALVYRRAVRAMANMSSVLVPVGSGIEVSRLRGPDDKGL